MPETEAIWRPLREVLDRDAVAVALPGFGAPWPAGFTGTKDAYAEWLAETLAGLDGPVDVVGHDLGALLTLRAVTAFDLPVRSWVVDVANIFHLGFTWPDRVLELQRPGVGEEMLERTNTASRLAGAGVPHDLAIEIGGADGSLMRRSILSFYRSAVPNVAAEWWDDVGGRVSGHGAVLLLPDPPEDEAMSVSVAERLGAETIRLDGLDHCWMAQSPSLVASRLERFWSSLDQA
jgi:pimeloyl-ACP methyl ester carboxylesterase